MSTLAHALRATPSLVRIAAASHVAYRAEMTIWILTALLPLVMLALWNAVAADGPIAGFGQADVARYFVITLVCRQLTGAWVLWELVYAIRFGQLSPQLLRPLNPLYRYAVWMATALPFRLAVLTPMVVALVVWRPELLQAPNPTALWLFLPSIALAWLGSFLVQCAFGLLSFWVDKSEGLFNVWFAIWALLSGYVAPVAFFPEAWQHALRLSPFYATMGAPVELLGGFLDPSEALEVVAVQALWVALALLAVSTLWRRGLARYGAFGA